MAQNITARGAGTPSASSERTATTTRALLACGVFGGPLFIVVSLVQVLTRQGFDIRRHAISMLSLGDLGWIQIANFVVAGLLAVGVWRVLHPRRGGTWGPLLVGAYGAGLITAGIFRTDPGFGFPAGAPSGMPAAFSWHAILHSVGFFVAFPSLIAACFVFVRRFAALGQRGWAACCAAIGVATPALIILGMIGPFGAGVPFFAAGVIAFPWVAVIAARLMTELAERTGSIDADMEPAS